MGLFSRAKEYRRTCKRDGTVWYVPAAIAHAKPPNKLTMAGARMTAAGSSTSLISFKASAKQQRIARLESRQTTLLEASRCPSCGSIDFEQTSA